MTEKATVSETEKKEAGTPAIGVKTKFDTSGPLPLLPGAKVEVSVIPDVKYDVLKKINLHGRGEVISKTPIAEDAHLMRCLLNFMQDKGNIEITIKKH